MHPLQHKKLQLQAQNIIHNAVNPTNRRMNKSTNQQINKSTNQRINKSTREKPDLLNTRNTVLRKSYKRTKESFTVLAPSIHALIEGINYIVKT